MEAKWALPTRGIAPKMPAYWETIKQRQMWFEKFRLDIEKIFILRVVDERNRLP